MHSTIQILLQKFAKTTNSSHKTWSNVTTESAAGAAIDIWHYLKKNAIQLLL